MRRVVVITGASAGAGRATALEFARRGYAVGLIARGLERLDATREEVERAGSPAVVLPADVADEREVERAADRAESELGPIDVWVNNAMATIFAPADRITPEEFVRATHVTYLGTVWGTLAALRRMKPRGRGSIVQVGSALSYRAIPLQSPYCGAKHAVRGFTDSVRTELLHEGSRIHLTMVQLPALNTPQFEWGRSRMPRRPQPVPPIFQPEVAAKAIAWAAEHRRREIYVGWPAVKAIVGNKVSPQYADGLLARMGYDAQQTDELDVEPRPDNLFEPVDGPYAARGRFGARALPFSWQLWATTHVGWIAAGLAGAMLGVARILSRRRKRCP
jgi:NAD(P)-dependent dehydrogenase (short-subunit alcohol dehydrogenase family)